DCEAIEAHVADCASCQRLTARERELRELLQAFGESSVPMPSEQFFVNALDGAASEGGRQHRNRWLATAFAVGLIALIGVWITNAVRVDTPLPAELTQNPVVSLTIGEPRVVNLVFSSATALPAASLTLQLPAGIEHMGFPGRRQVSWSTSLRSGRNLLPLTFVATADVAGEVVATLEHGDNVREFRLQINVF
ncbi:MAG: hypothetical protein RIA65_16220, partial [Woeseia sp.]